MVSSIAHSLASTLWWGMSPWWAHLHECHRLVSVFVHSLSSNFLPVLQVVVDVLLRSRHCCLISLAGSCIGYSFLVHKLTILLIWYRIHVDDINCAEKIRLFLCSHMFHTRAVSTTPLSFLIHCDHISLISLDCHFPLCPPSSLNSCPHSHVEYVHVMKRWYTFSSTSWHK